MLSCTCEIDADPQKHNALPNGAVSSLSYDAAGNLLSITHRDDAGNLIGRYSYTYDATGRRVGAIESGVTITYTYDALYRLTQATASDGDVYQYAYDAAGNRTGKVEPGVNETATYDAANQLISLNPSTGSGQAFSYDANGNLLDDGRLAYQYDDFDRLIRVTQGMTVTTYGYTGDGDRLWQATDGVTTTFTLDLNAALTQVLAQSQSGGPATYFLPGVGQQVNGLWYYYHADALGSVRQMTGPTGSSIGSVNYSPFGEIVDSTGLLPLFGFTGQQQESSTGLTYLRSRYYNPAHGRFLTPDSLIPDVTNGQALNAYAYVYNDPLNLVDPGGNIPIPPVPPINLPNIPWETMAVATARGGLNFLDWWQNSSPQQCDCQGGASAFWGPVAGVSIQGINGVVTKPAEMYGTKTVERLVTKQVERSISLQWLNNSKLMRRMPILRALMPNKIGLGTRTVQEWQVVSRETGALNELADGRLIPRVNGTHQINSTTRVTIDTKPTLRSGITGFAGAAAWAAWIDGFTQLASDWKLCLSPMQKANRFALSLVLGLAAGTAGGLAFVAFAGASTVLLPIAAGLAFGYGASVFFNYAIRQPWYERRPDLFGT